MILSLFLCAAALFSTDADTDPEDVSTPETTSITFTRTEVAQMALLWETETVAISPLADAQYPIYSGDSWQFIFPHTNISSDGDVHADMAVDSSGTGSSGNNTGESPIVCELINANSAQLNHLNSLNADDAIFRGIFRFYTEHPGERHFELHPVTELDTWNGSTFVPDSDYHSNIISDPNGTTHPNSTLIAAIDGSQTMTATIENDNTRVDFVSPSPSVNYVQYAGVALSTVTSDSTSSYFLFRPNLVPGATLRCRLVANTAAASGATGLIANQSITVNALTRTDMGFVANQIAPLTAGQSATFPRQIELIVLGLPGFGPPNPTQIVSQKTHGAASFGIDLPLLGTPGIECRSSAPSGNHQLAVTFATPVTFTSATVTSGTGIVANASAVGNQVIVNLSGVTNAQTITTRLFNISDGAKTGDLVIPMSVLLGDTNGNGTVSASDIGQTKAQSGQLTTGANFRTDVNINGSITAADIGLVKSSAGTGLP